MILAKGLEALGIASVMIGLVQGILSETMWMELYLSIAGITIFFIGWLIERNIVKRRNSASKMKEQKTAS